MKTVITKSVPEGDFQEVSIEKSGWKRVFADLVIERKPVKYDTYTLPIISKEAQDQLRRQNYIHVILESDPEQHFLVPLAP